LVCPTASTAVASMSATSAAIADLEAMIRLLCRRSCVLAAVV
jgi:hypothetical protein